MWSHYQVLLFPAFSVCKGLCSHGERNHQMSADLTENLLLYICADQNKQALSACTVLGVLNQLERSSGHVVLQ